jgi:hypothetical protein
MGHTIRFDSEKNSPGKGRGYSSNTSAKTYSVPNVSGVINIGVLRLKTSVVFCGTTS